MSMASRARVRSPGDRSRAGPADVVGAEAELGQQRARLAHRPCPVRSWNVASTAASPANSAAAPGRAAPTSHARPEPAARRRPAAARRAGRRSSVVLPLPLGPTMASRSCHADLEVDRARAGTCPRSTTAPGRGGRRRRRCGPPAPAPARAASPPTACRPPRAGRAGRSVIFTFDACFSLRCDPRAGAMFLSARRCVLALRTPGLAPLRLACARRCLEPSPLGTYLLVGLVLLAPGQVARRRRSRSSRRRTPRPGGVLLDLDDAVPRVPVEEGPVVRHDQHRAGEAVDEALEQVDAGEVEVVGGLVEQQHVDPRQQDRGQRGPGRLAARQRRRPPDAKAGRRRPQPDGGAHLARPGPRGRRRRGRGSGRARRCRRRPTSGSADSASVQPVELVGRPRPRRCGGPGSRAASRRAGRRAPGGGSPRSATPGARSTRPPSGRSSPASTRSRVDLPTPFGPDHADPVAPVDRDRHLVEHGLAPERPTHPHGPQHGRRPYAPLADAPRRFPRPRPATRRR